MTSKTREQQLSTYSLIEELYQLDVDSATIFTELFAVVGTHLVFDAATLYILNSETNSLEKVQSINQDVEILSGFQIESGDGLSGWSADSAKSLLISDRTKKKSYNPETDFASFLSIPILRNKILYGVINFGSFTKENFTQEDIHSIEKISPIMSYIITNYQLSNSLDKIKSAYINSVDQLETAKNHKVTDLMVNQISTETSEVIHSINNSLSIILGNLQCLLIGSNEFNQKSLSRLKRIEVAAKKISESNNTIMSLNSLVNLKPKIDSTTIES